MSSNKRIAQLTTSIFIVCGLLVACTPSASHDVILRGGNIYDGSGGDPYIGDVAIVGDKIVLISEKGTLVVIAAGREFNEISRSALGENCFA